MKGIDQSIVLAPGDISLDKDLGGYYQDFTPSIIHIEKGVFAAFDEDGIPYSIISGRKEYSIVLVIQYGLICFDLIIKGENKQKNKQNFLKVINWLELKKETYMQSYVWRNPKSEQYNLNRGWISGMYQGQALSLYLRAYQLFNENTYFETATKIFHSFSIDYKSGGFRRIDSLGCIWFEEYPTEKPSYVLNGFIYSILGVLDFYRVSKREDSYILWKSCVNTLIVNLPKYDKWYWSVYDQLKKQLVSYYYQKNVHLPLMQIMYGLTNEKIFDYYALKWDKNLKNPYHRIITKIMYRIQPRLKKLRE